MSETLAYFITWTTYGTWLQGDARGWIDKKHNGPGMAINPPNPVFEMVCKKRMKGEAVYLTDRQRAIVEQAIAEVANFRDWQLIGMNCRTNHVHAIVKTSGAGADRVLNDFKAYCTRALRKNGFFVEQDVWTEGGSKRHINTEASLRSAIQYVKFQ